MGTFALPIPAYRLGQHSKRKRKRSSASLDGDEEAPAHFAAEPPSSPPVQPSPRRPQDAVINPRSHDPDTLRQFAVAGLAAEAEVPSKLHPSFPHKALPSEGGGLLRRRRCAASARAPSGSEADVDTDASEGAPRAPAGPRAAHADELSLQYSARVRHINTLTAALHRFLHEGDMPRARRAFALLLRTRDIDLRLNGLWNVGAEILMRGDAAAEGGRPDPGRRGAGERPGEAEAETAYGEGWGLGDEAAPEAQRHDPDAPRRWGTAANAEKVSEYLRALAQQYPYDLHRPQLTSAVDFWPALFSVEIYNADAEFRLARHRLAVREDADDETEGSPSPLPSGMWQESLKAEAEEDEEGEDDYEARIRRRGDAREARRWAAYDEVRRATQGAAQQIAARMDGVMENRPYTENLELLRLRALLALYIGDLHLPARLVAEGRPPAARPPTAATATATTVSRDERAAVARRAHEFDKARALLTKILDRGGTLEPRMQALVDGDADADDDAPDVEMSW